MRAIDADALEREISVSHSMIDDCGIKTGYEICMRLVEDAPTIEPERKNGKWIVHPGGKFVGFPYVHYECDQCRDFEPEERNFCPNCGADMRTPVETARDIVHKAIDNSVWSDTVDTAKMHEVVDDKYAEMTKKTEESKRCDTCKHEKERWFSRCADCSDFELWESKE